MNGLILELVACKLGVAFALYEIVYDLVHPLVAGLREEGVGFEQFSHTGHAGIEMVLDLYEVVRGLFHAQATDGYEGVGFGGLVP